MFKNKEGKVRTGWKIAAVTGAMLSIIGIVSFLISIIPTVQMIGNGDLNPRTMEYSDHGHINGDTGNRLHPHSAHYLEIHHEASVKNHGSSFLYKTYRRPSHRSALWNRLHELCFRRNRIIGKRRRRNLDSPLFLRYDNLPVVFYPGRLRRRNLWTWIYYVHSAPDQKYSRCHDYILSHFFHHAFCQFRNQLLISISLWLVCYLPICI